MAGAERKAMIVSVGGTPAPILHTLDQRRPMFICFFVSQQTKALMESEILPKLRFRPRHHDWILTENADQLSECYAALARRLPEILEKWEVPPQDVCVDYTGGTKTMSVALALATIESSCCYSYVGGDERSKGGVGVVLDGRERMWFLDNPWDQVALKETREACILFNKAHYASAAEVLKQCIDRVSDESKPFFKAMRDMVEGYDLWDRFKQKDGRSKLYQSRSVLRTVAFVSDKKKYRALISSLDENLRFLDEFVSATMPSRRYYLDLLANAKRRADIEHKFDDAVARLYRAMEVLAQVELRSSFGIDSGDVQEDSLPEGIRQEYVLKYRSETPDGFKIKIPLFAAYRLLRELGNRLGEAFMESYDGEIRSLLDARNSSILAHGFNPVAEKTFERLWGVTLRFSSTTEEELPRFPELDLL